MKNATFALLLLVSVACEAPPSPFAPSAPAPRTHSAESAPSLLADPRRAPARIDRWFYDQLVFNAFDSAPVYDNSFVLPAPSRMDIVLNRWEVSGYCGEFEHGIPMWKGWGEIGYRHIVWRDMSAWIERATGRPHTGRVYSVSSRTMTDLEDVPWGTILIRLKRDVEDGAAGRAYVGANPGTITIILDSDCGVKVYSVAAWQELLAHELGHALGFWHVSGDDDVMGGWDAGGYRRQTFTHREHTHMTEAYRRGPSHTRNLAPSDGPVRLPLVEVVD